LRRGPHGSAVTVIHNPPAEANARRETQRQLQALNSQVVKLDYWPQGRKNQRSPAIRN
jgi:hypothetical protein